MPRCQDVARLSSAYLEGELPWRQRLAIRAHLAMCRFCRLYVQQLQLTVRWLGGLSSIPDAAGAGEGRPRCGGEASARTLFRRVRAPIDAGPKAAADRPPHG